MTDYTTTTTTTTVRTTTSATPTTRVVLLIDESESMLGVKALTISTVNEYVSTLRGLPGQVLVSLVFFNSTNAARVVYRDRPVSDVRPIGANDYHPADMTPLYDAVGSTIRMMDGSDHAPAKVLFVLQTDGLENRSSEFKTAESIAALVKAREAQGWTFLYLGADLSKAQATHAAMAMGISAANTQSYDKSVTRQTYGNLAAATANFHSTQQAGQSTSDFWSQHGGVAGQADEILKKANKQ